jgi:ribosome-binding factor A
MIVLHELKDPRIDGSMLTVMEVRTTADLKYAKVYVSYMGDPGKRVETFAGLNHCAGYIRQQLKTRVKIRTLPALTFIEDTSIAYAAHITKVIDDATATIRTEEQDDGAD